jgi:hypothetical protein
MASQYKKINVHKHFYTLLEMELIDHIQNLPLEIQNEIMNWYAISQGSLIASSSKKCYATYGHTATRDLLLGVSNYCNLATFEELESYFDYRLLEHPKQLFVSAIRGHNIKFIVDYINSGRGRASLIVDEWSNIAEYILPLVTGLGCKR